MDYRTITICRQRKSYASIKPASLKSCISSAIKQMVSSIGKNKWRAGRYACQISILNIEFFRQYWQFYLIYCSRVSKIQIKSVIKTTNIIFSSQEIKIEKDYFHHFILYFCFLFIQRRTMGIGFCHRALFRMSVLLPGVMSDWYGRVPVCWKILQT